MTAPWRISAMLHPVWLLRPEGVVSFCVGAIPDDAVGLAGLVGVEPRTGQRHGFFVERRLREPASPRQEVSSGRRSVWDNRRRTRTVNKGRNQMLREAGVTKRLSFAELRVNRLVSQRNMNGV